MRQRSPKKLLYLRSHPRETATNIRESVRYADMLSAFGEGEMQPNGPRGEKGEGGGEGG